MRVLHTPLSSRHNPPLFFRRGKSIAHPESAERYATLREAARAGGHDLVDNTLDHGLAPIAGVHDGAYLDFLSTAWARRTELDATADELLTTQFARPQAHRRSSGLVNQIGYHTADTSTPIREDTWEAVYASAQVAVAAADHARVAGAAYALCRPPGHHAYAGSAGGFCYLNNTAIAAQRLRDAGCKRVAVFDIDVHHGNGTQGIFYARADVLTVSIHADPTNYFPLFSGYADETGVGAGEGFNLNLPLPHGAGDGDVMAAFEPALTRIRKFAPDALVVALGLDMAAGDPMGVFEVSEAGFARMAEAIARIGLPTVLVQEGGYLCPALPVNLAAFLAAFDAER